MNKQSNRNDDALPKDDALDLLLEAQFHNSSEELQPSSGFVQSVMQSIQTEAREPSPIAFPWRRILPGMAVIVCSLLLAAISLIRHGPHFEAAASATSTFRLSNIASTLSSSSREAAICWILVAVCLAIAVTATSFRLAGRPE